MREIPLFLYAKAPIAGKVKTRLHSHCTPQQAAQIAQILLEESIKQASQYWQGEVILSVGLDSQHPFLTTMCARYSIEMVAQCSGDLGEKMQHTFTQAGYPAAIMGCDAPHTSATTLQTAYQLLQESQSFIAPSVDGGYYLIGLAQAAPSLFNGPQWSSNTVRQTTLENAQQIALPLQQLAPLNDVDQWQDVLSVATLLPSLQDYLTQQQLLT